VGVGAPERIDFNVRTNMELSSEDKMFLSRREKLVRFWPAVGAGMLVVVAGFVVWLWFTTPYLINPWYVSGRIQSGTLPDSMAYLMAGMLPVVMLALIAVTVAAVVLAFVAFANERRLVRLLRQLEKAQTDDASSTAQ
jgi:type VI protein secretion system component VasF